MKNLSDEKRPSDWNGWSHEERCRAILDMINDATNPKFPYKIEEFGSFGFGEWEKLEVLLATAFYMIGEDGPSGGWFRDRMRSWFDNADIRMQRIVEKLSERSHL